MKKNVSTKEKIFLLPEIIKSDDVNHVFYGAKLISTRPVEVNHYAIFTFINRLDQTGYSYQVVTTVAPNKKVYLYPHTFPADPPDFKSLDFIESPTDEGIVVHLLITTFEILDEKDHAVRVKSGDWMKVSNLFNQIAALNHLGIISDLSPPVFSMVSSIDRWTESLHQAFGTNGTLSDALIVIFKRMMFASQIFDISALNLALDQYNNNTNNKNMNVMNNKNKYNKTHNNVNNNNNNNPINNDTNNINNYCFGIMVSALQTSAELDVIRHILPIPQRSTSRFYVLNQFLQIIYEALNKNGFKIHSIDDYNDFKEALSNFQEMNNLTIGACDVETLKRLSYMTNFKIVEPLPIFRMSGIEVTYDQVMDFPTMKQLEKDPDGKPLGERVRQEINRSIVATADPKAKIEWMNEKMIDCVKTSNERCNILANQVAEIERKVTIMYGMLKDVTQESQSATGRVKLACKTLSTVYDAHVKIQGKFEILRDRLFSEQKNTRIILLIGIFFSFIGALELFRR
ncbi:hypothetical protein TRFO_15134 [Tritrichomonas foetus]|uniref:Uncharacterized protein n=1 Tax=Tritrichomonas foetus TaxID=1144522 RepID=A0A1J4KT72_9EUKA|nr:hypothetical protein TRFO_15134 [Tritrichomonas foetus]|eukprot:OHT14481.1 hypothetical protein TRFO_15134 [Tritrichomonas foetus]